MLPASVGPGAERLAIESAYDKRVREYVEDHGVPDYIYVVNRQTVHLLYLREDTIASFTRGFMPDSDVAVRSGIPDEMLELVSTEDRSNVLASRGELRSDQESERYAEAVENFRRALSEDPNNDSYAEKLRIAIERAYAHEIHTADQARARSDLVAERTSLQRALSYKPSHHEVLARLDHVTAEIAERREQYVSLAEALLHRPGRRALAHAALLYGRAAYLHPSSSELAQRFTQLREELTRTRHIFLIYNCESETAGTCNRLRQITEKEVNRLPMPAQFIDRAHDRSPRTDLIQIDLRIGRASVSDEVLSGPSERTSRHVTGYRQEVDPLYTQAAVDYQQAVQSYNEWRIINASNPSLFSIAGLISSKSTLEEATARLNSLSPIVETAIHEPYTYNEYRLHRSSEIPAVVRAYDKWRGIPIFQDELIGKTESSSLIRTGLSPTDSDGLVDRKVSREAAETLSRGAISALEDQYESIIAERFDSLDEKLGAMLADRSAGEAYELTALIILQNREMSELSNLPAFLEENLLVDLEFAQHDVSKEPPNLKLTQDFPTARLPEVASAGALRVPSGASVQTLFRVCEPAVAYIEAGPARGSGFFIAPDGVLVTNAHVIEGASNVVVQTLDGKLWIADVMATISDFDLAFLKLGTSYGYLRLADPDKIEVGMEVVAIGAPQGLKYSVTRGIVSQLREIGDLSLVQHDAAINPGSSGGPLLDRDGRVIGVNTVKLIESEGLGFAISAENVQSALSRAMHSVTATSHPRSFAEIVQPSAPSRADHEGLCWEKAGGHSRDELERDNGCVRRSDCTAPHAATNVGAR